MKKLLIASLLGMSLLAYQAQAAQIDGKIEIIGGLAILDGPMQDANAIVGFPMKGFVSPISDGDYAGVVGTPVTTLNGFTFDPALVPNPVAPLWSFVAGGKTYSFDLANVNIATQNSTFLNLTGSGTLYITGFDPTPGTWAFTMQQSKASTDVKFGFTSSNAAVPDGGMTMALLGLGIAVVEGLRRKLA